MQQLRVNNRYNIKQLILVLSLVTVGKAPKKIEGKGKVLPV